MARRTRAWHTLQASKAEALVAVDLYNGSGRRRSFEGFVVHMHLAWLYLLHAEFQRDHVDFRYWADARHLQKVDGEPKTWELGKCLRHRWPSDKDPVRVNLEFFVALRNKIEHRYQDGIALSVAGHAQALLMNYESELVSQFGAGQALADRLRFPVFLSSLTEEGVTALKKIRASIPARVARFIDQFHASLDEETTADNRFEFRMFLIPHIGPKSEADLAVTFVQQKDLTPEQLDAMERLGQTGLVATRTREVPVQNKGRYLPHAVVAQVRAFVPTFGMGDHTAKWKEHAVRPSAGAANPTVTDARYCVYDEPVATYLYTDAWVKKMIREAKTEYEGRRRWSPPSSSTT